jgi:hypothetical protein
LSGHKGILAGTWSAADKAAPEKVSKAAMRAGMTSIQRGFTTRIQPEAASKRNLRMGLMIEIPPTPIGLGVLG